MNILYFFIFFFQTSTTHPVRRKFPGRSAAGAYTILIICIILDRFTHLSPHTFYRVCNGPGRVIIMYIILERASAGERETTMIPIPKENTEKGAARQVVRSVRLNVFLPIRDYIRC